MGLVDALLIGWRKFVLIAFVDELLRGIDKADAVVALVLLQHNDAGGYRSTNEQVAGQLDNGIHEVVLDEILRQLAATKELIANSGDLELQNKMTDLLRKLAELEFNYNSMEGVVFSWRGRTFKLTGTFAALNRAINLRIDYGKKYNNKNQA